MRIGIIDIESNGLLADMVNYSAFPYRLKDSAKLWCVVVRDLYTDEYVYAVKEEVTKEWLKNAVSEYDVIVAHNGIKFDCIALKLFGIFDYTIGYLEQNDTLFGKPVRFIDTLILSRITNPDRFGGHSLEVWGERVGEHKMDFRKARIAEGSLEPNAPKGAEFLTYTPLMLTYCIQDTKVNSAVYRILAKELGDYDGWKLAIKQEHKLADIAIRRENLGFWFDKDYAIHLLDDLGNKLQELTDKVNPILPERPLTKGELKDFTPPKSQLNKEGKLTAAMSRFIEKVGATTVDDNTGILFENDLFTFPIEMPIKTKTKATIDNLDAVKMHLIALGWNPSEWKERDLTKDSKKQNLNLEKRIKALDTWYADTMGGKYKAQRLEFLKADEATIYNSLKKRLSSNRPVRVPTSPAIRVGVEKELCPDLIRLGDKVAFAKDFADYLTYKHRKSTIAGGDIEEMDFDSETPNTGFLKIYRDVDGRVPTPAIEIGASTNRYRHIGIANIPRAGSVYGKEMRSLFGSGKSFLQLGFDFASLEARIEGHYTYDGTDGVSYAESLIAEKPNDVHTVNSIKLGIPRSDAKSFKYALTYGAQIAKIMKMLACSREEAEAYFENFWLAAPALKEFKDVAEAEWLSTGKKYVKGIDGRKINIRSQHSIINALFQSAGVICAKYTTIFLMQELEEQGYCIDPFEGKPDCCSMIEYHDENQLAINPKIAEFLSFDVEDDAEAFAKLWEGEQLSAVSHGKGDSYYVCLPNVISKAISNAINRAAKLVNLKVPLGFEWIVNKNWYGCH